MEFKAGDAVVVPGVGVGVVESRGSVDIPGAGAMEAYRVDLGETDGTTWIPVRMATLERLRPVMSPEEADAAWVTMAAQIAPEKRGNWKDRKRRYTELVNGGRPEHLAEVTGELQKVDAIKPISTGERELMEKARRLLVAEIAVVRGESPEEVDKRVTEVVSGS